MLSNLSTSLLNAAILTIAERNMRALGPLCAKRMEFCRTNVENYFHKLATTGDYSHTDEYRAKCHILEFRGRLGI